MVFVNNARNDLRDRMESEVNEAAVGTDGTSASETDTSIGNEVVSKSEGDDELDISNDGDGGSLYEFTVTLSEANGETLREVVLRSGTGLWVRMTHAGVEKENDFELDYEISTSFDN